VVKPIAQAFLAQIKGEFETNELLKGVYPDVLYRNPRTLGPDGRPAKWSLERGLTVKRKGNPKEATIEAHGLIDGQPTSRHFQLHIYDDVVTQDYLSEERASERLPNDGSSPITSAPTWACASGCPERATTMPIRAGW
jgi:hypothetical protein